MAQRYHSGLVTKIFLVWTQLCSKLYQNRIPNHMKYLLFAVSLLTFLIACEQHSNKALSTFTSYVDSLSNQNEVWKMGSDTLYVESPLDERHPEQIVVDTILEPHAAKGGILNDIFKGREAANQLDSLKQRAEEGIDGASASERKAFEDAVKKIKELQ